MKMHSRRRLCFFTVIAGAVTGSGTPAQAANVTWDPSNGNWNTTDLHWNGGTTAFTNGDDALFSSGFFIFVQFNTPAGVSPTSTTMTGGVYFFQTPGATPLAGIASGSFSISGGSAIMQSYNTYTGVTTISGGEFTAQGNTAGTPALALANGGQASSVGASSSDASNLIITNGAKLSIDRAGSGATTTDRLFTIGTSAIINANTETNFTNTGAIAFAAPNQTTTLTFQGHSADLSRPFTFSPLLTNNGSGVLTVNASARNMVMANTNNSFTGAFSHTQLSGQLTVYKLADGGQNSSIGASSSAASNFKMFGGNSSSAFVLKYVGTGDSTNRNYTIQDAQRTFTIDSSGTGALVMSGAATYQNTGNSLAATFSLTGTSNAALINRYIAPIANSNVISNSPMTMSFSKAGTNTWQIEGNNTYNGDTTISGGTLLVNGGLSTTTKTATATAAGNTVNIQSGTTGANMQYGAYVFGTGIAAGTRVTNVDTNNNILTLSAATSGVSNGTVLSFVTGSGTGTGAVNVNAGTLGGSGLVYGATTIANNATLSPGATTGVLSFGRTLTMAGTDSKTNITVGNGARGTAYDGVDVAGALAYNGDLTLTIDTALATGTYDLFNFGSQSGNFDSITVTGAGPYSGSFTYDGLTGLWSSAAFGDTTLQFSTASGDLMVPEPAGLSLVLAAGMGLLARRRRGRQEA